MNREDFPMFKNNIIYFDSGATTFKPKCVIDSIVDYYSNYSANAHRGDYSISLTVDSKYEGTRQLVKEFINASSTKEIIFTSGTTDSLNKIVFGYFANTLKKGDEVLITKSEHASNILPWFELSDLIGIKVNYIPLDENYELTLENLEKVINPNTKVISIAHITNVVGDIRPIKEICSYAHKNNIKVVVDAAQSIAHTQVDVRDLDADFLAFSGHKMMGPTGIGVLYGKEINLNNMKPIVYGGGMNATFNSDNYREYKELPHLFEAGTPNIAGVIGLGRAISYINSIGIKKINEYELSLKEYALNKLKEIDDIIIYNEKSKGSIIAFNKKDIFSQDLAIYLNKYNICVRAGNHCAKVLKDEFKIKNTCRISLAMYNTKEEIDKLVELLKNKNIKKEII